MFKAEQYGPNYKHWSNIKNYFYNKSKKVYLRFMKLFLLNFLCRVLLYKSKTILDRSKLFWTHQNFLDMVQYSVVKCWFRPAQNNLDGSKYSFGPVDGQGIGSKHVGKSGFSDMFWSYALSIYRSKTIFGPIQIVLGGPKSTFHDWILNHVQKVLMGPKQFGPVQNGFWLI